MGGGGGEEEEEERQIGKERGAVGWWQKDGKEGGGARGELEG